MGLCCCFGRLRISYWDSMAMLLLFFLLAVSVVSADEGGLLSFYFCSHCFPLSFCLYYNFWLSIFFAETELLCAHLWLILLYYSIYV